MKIELSYFKGIRNLAVDCDRDIVNVCGANGTGKTTVADAIQWCLFGKNSIGETKFGIKTLQDGQVIPNAEHSVLLNLLIDGAPKAVKRVWVEDRVMKRGRETGEVKHHAEFYVDGERYSKVDFDTFVAGLMNESMFRLVTNPNYFFANKWAEQRELLQELVGNVDYSVLNQEEQYSDILPKIKEHENLEGYKKHLAYNIKLVKDKMEQIPARIDEQRQTMPEAEDWAAIEKMLADINDVLTKKEQEIVALKTDSGNSSKNQYIRQQIEFQRKRMDEMMVSARNMALSKAREHEEKLRVLHQELVTAQRNVDEAKAKKKSNEFLLARCKESLADIERKIFQLREDWKANEAKCFALAEDALVCPTCGRPYEEGKREEVISNAKESFALQKETKRSELRTLAEQYKQFRADAEAQVKTYEEAVAEDYTNLETKLSEIQQAYDEMEKVSLPTAEELLATNASYKDARTRMHELELQLDNGTAEGDNHDVLRRIEAERNEYAAQKETLVIRYANKNIVDSHDKRIKELEQEQESLQQQLSGLLIMDDIARDYEQAMNELLENEVNKHFQKVKFRLFDTLNDGTKKPWCTATINGVEYADANRAAQMNAGLEVCEVFSKFRDFYAPIIVDNAEAINDIYKTTSQQVRLYVTTDSQLKIG